MMSAGKVIIHGRNAVLSFPEARVNVAEPGIMYRENARDLGFSVSVVFVVLIIVLLVKPTGILGKKINEKV